MPRPRAAWVILVVLLAALAGGAATFEREGWPGPVGEEATCAMAAASLARDLDLRYSREDHDRFVSGWRAAPEGLRLERRSREEAPAFAVPFLYPLVAAPFVRFAPVRGLALANAVLLALAALAVARVLERRVGEAGPALVAVFAFASAAFGAVFLAQPEVLSLAATAGAFALLYRLEAPRVGRLPDVWEEPGAPGLRLAGRCTAAGALLAVPAAHHPFYLVLFLPGLLALPRPARWAPRVALLGGAVAMLLAAFAVHDGMPGEGWPRGGARARFDAASGFPAVDFATGEWPARAIERGGPLPSWARSPWSGLDGRLVLWNGIYFLAGRDVGALPYFVPLALAIAAWGPGGRRWALLAAAALAALAFLLLEPFDFFGGPGAVANRRFLPLFGALWLLPNRSARTSWALATAALAAPFLYGLWLAPRTPFDAEGRLRYPTAVARRILPFETTQRDVAGVAEVTRGAVRLRFPGPSAWPGPGGLRLMGDAPAHLVIAAPDALDSATFELEARATNDLEVRGGELGSTTFRPGGEVAFEVRLGPARIRHPVWWSRELHHVYPLRLELPGAPPAPLAFDVRLEPLGRGAD